MTDDLESRVRHFLQGKVDSVEQLNILILLHLDAGRAWTVERITDELRSSHGSVSSRLKMLIQVGILAPEAIRDGEVFYVPKDREVAALVSDTISLYRSKPYRVMDMIYSKPQDPIQALADAFKFKKDKKD